MNSKAFVRISVIGVAAVLMLVLSPITVNHQTFGYTYSYHGPLPHYKYFHISGKKCFIQPSLAIQPNPFTGRSTQNDPKNGPVFCFDASKDRWMDLSDLVGSNQTQ
jgi:hypothetical protein